MQGKVVIGTELDTKSFDKQIQQLETKLQRLEASYEKALNPPEGFKTDEEALSNLEVQIEKTSNKLVELKDRQNNVGKADFSQINKSLNSVGNSIERSIKKLGKMALAVFGIRSAFMFVRNAINTITNDDEQLKADIDYMKSALAYTLEPIVRAIVNLAKQLMFYIGYIIKAWTGKNIFANANKSLKNSAKNAKALNKELNKTIASFDEMNVLQSSSGGGDTSGGASPSFDLSNLDNIKVPKWLEWMAKNKDIVLALMAGVTAGLLAWKLGFSALQSLGIGIAIAGIVYAITALIDYLKDPSWENFGKVITGIGIAVAGVAIMFGAWPVAVAGALLAVVGIIVSHWEEIKKLFDKAIEWLTDQMNKVKEKYGYFAGLIVKSVRDQVKNIRDTLDTIFKKAKDILDNIISFFKNVFASNWKGAWKNVVNIAKDVFDIFISSLKFKFNTIKNMVVGAFGAIGDVIGGIIKGSVNTVFRWIESKINDAIRMFNTVLTAVNKLPGVSISRISLVHLPRLAQGGIVNNPGNGVFMGGYVAGERGPEAVLPLTEETFDRLGLAIGRHTSINATIPIYAYNRQVAREIRRIEANQSFATNGR